MKIAQFLVVLFAVLANAVEETERNTLSTNQKTGMIYYSVRVTTKKNIPDLYMKKANTIETIAGNALYKLAEPQRRTLRSDQSERRMIDCSLCDYMPILTCIQIYGSKFKGCRRRASEETLSAEDLEEYLSRHLEYGTSKCETAIEATKSEMLKELGESGLDWFEDNGKFECFKEFM